MSFLTAEWRKLALANYEVPPDMLSPFVPKGTEIDLFKGKCYVSLVGFMFLNTRLMGVKVPGHVNFEEVNLRFYVKRGMDSGEVRRGVVFIKEIVPKPALTFVANTIYKEHYETMPMKHSWKHGEILDVTYQWRKGGWNSFSLKATTELQELISGSKEEFITEHYWGYSKANGSKTIEYEVKHPKWQVYSVIEHSINVDFEKVYGHNFDFLKDKNPDSVMLAEGSQVSVEQGSKL